MKVLFRADSNKNIGMGHIMRCLSIADALSDIGDTCFFVTADSNPVNLIKERGYEALNLESDYSDTKDGIDKLMMIIDSRKPDLIISDSYFVDNDYFGQLKCATRLAYLDDIFGFAYDTDILINYNVYADEDVYRKLYLHDGNKRMPEMILGPLYAPIRKEFFDVPIPSIKKDAKKVLVSVGGTDPLHMAKGFTDAIGKRKKLIERSEFIFVLGKMEPDLEEILKLSESNPWLTVKVNVKDMRSLMQSVDMAISAAGSTQYELCACGVPSINYSMADNQVPGGEAFGRSGLFSYAGDARNNVHFFDDDLNRTEAMLEDYDLRQQMSKRQRKLIDGNGAVRLADKIHELISTVDMRITEER